MDEVSCGDDCHACCTSVMIFVKERMTDACGAFAMLYCTFEVFLFSWLLYPMAGFVLGCSALGQSVQVIGGVASRTSQNHHRISKNGRFAAFLLLEHEKQLKSDSRCRFHIGLLPIKQRAQSEGRIGHKALTIDSP